MPYYVEKQIQVAMERGDFNKLPGKGKRQELEVNPHSQPDAQRQRIGATLD